MKRWSMLRAGGFQVAGVALLCLWLAACGAGSTSASQPPAHTGAAAVRPTATGVAPAGAAAHSPTPTITGRPPVTPTPSVAAPALNLACTIHTSAGSDDDETEQALSCSVTHAPAADTRFTLTYGVRDPAGALHTFTQTCDGSLHAGAGSCSATYDFILPYAPVPGPVSGVSLPSNHPLGPTTPQS